MESLKVYMLVSLNKSFKNIGFVVLGFLLLGCSNTSKNKKEVVSTKSVEITSPKLLSKPKKEPVKLLSEKDIDSIRELTKPKMLVPDIINHKNVRSFFLDYGRKNPETKLLLKTRLGNMHITLYKETPLHRASFIYLIKNGYYNKTCFHRIVKDFIIQAGWSDNPIVDKYRAQLNKYRLPAEFRDGVVHKKGALSAARRWLNNPQKKSSPFEFYIMQTDDNCSHLDNEHTVFGQVTSGFDVIDKIGNVKLDANSEWPEVNVDVEFIILK